MPAEHRDQCHWMVEIPIAQMIAQTQRRELQKSLAHIAEK